jgi:serine/threonine protein kinase
MVEMPDDNGMPHIKYIHPSCEEVFKRWKDLHPKLYIVDFGLTTWWKDPVTDKPYPEVKRNIKNKTGTARYASLNVHRGKPHARRDDIESLGYLLLDLIFGTLPWTGIQARNSRAGWDRMRHIKEDTFMSDLCAGLPQGLLEFIEYSRKLRFAEEPNYELLRQFLSGSVNQGCYSSIVRSPFGGHTERKWLQDIEREDPTPKTREDMARPYTNNRQPHYEPPSYEMNTPPPRQRRASYNQPTIHRQHDDAGVFAMDDLANHLPQDKPHTAPTQRGKSRGNHHHNNTNNNNNVHRRASRDLGRHEPPTRTGQSSFQKLVAKTRRKQKRVGWNSHKHDEAPWVPATDWEVAPEKPDISIQHASWGDDKPTGEWGQKAWGAEEEEGSWAANIQKPWE